MISANNLRQQDFTIVSNGYNIEEVNSIIDDAASTIEAYSKESTELYHKLEVLAGKIEEYREEEDSIKTALISAQKLADKIKRDSNETASQLITTSEDTAKATLDEANEKAEKIVSEAREFASSVIKEKTAQANTIVADAQSKANDAISSAKIVAQDILNQAKSISDDLISKSKEEKQAYDLLIKALKSDAESFILNLKSLYNAQLDVLEAAKLENSSDEAQTDESNVDDIQNEVDSLVDEIEEMENAIPEEIKIEQPEAVATQDTLTDIPDDVDVVVSNIENDVDNQINEEEQPQEFKIVEEDSQESTQEQEEQPADPMQAVEAFSQNEITPIDTSSPAIPEIDEEAQMENDESLFDKEEQRPFEAYFNIKREDAHGDKTQTISLIPPDEEEEQDESKFKGFFKKKK
jgi:cell division initiation protein